MSEIDIFKKTFFKTSDLEQMFPAAHINGENWFDNSSSFS